MVYDQYACWQYIVVVHLFNAERQQDWCEDLTDFFKAKAKGTILRELRLLRGDDKMATIANLMWEDGCNIDGAWGERGLYVEGLKSKTTT